MLPLASICTLCHSLFNWEKEDPDLLSNMEELLLMGLERAYKKGRGKPQLPVTEDRQSSNYQPRDGNEDAIFLQRLQELRARHERRRAQAIAADPDGGRFDSLLVKKTKFDYGEWYTLQRAVRFGERMGRHLRHSSASCQLCELAWSVINKYQNSMQDLNTCKVHVDLLINYESFKPEGVAIILDEDDYQAAEELKIWPAEGTRLFHNTS
jgi:hypothetical protein